MQTTHLITDPNYIQPLHEEEEIHLQDYLSVLYRRKKTVLFVFFTVFIGVALFTFLQKPVYEATATLHVKDDKVKNGGGVLADLGLNQENPIETEIQILKSRTNAEEVVGRLNLDWQVTKKSKDLEFNIKEFFSLSDIPIYKVEVTAPGTYQISDMEGRLIAQGSSGSLLKKDEVTLLLDDLQGKAGDSFQLQLCPFNRTVASFLSNVKAAEVGRSTNIINLSYRDTDPERAREVVNTLAQVYVEHNIANKTEEATKSVEFIEQQLEDVRSLLDTAEQGLEGYKRSSGVVKLDSEAEAVIGRLTETEKERTSVFLRQSQMVFAIDAVKKAFSQNDIYTPTVLLNDPVVTSLSSRLAELGVEKRGLLVDLTPAHPKVLSIQEQITEIQNKLLATYQTVLNSLIDHGKMLDTDLKRYEVELKKLPEAERELAQLTRKAKVNADIYIFLLQKHEESRIAKAATISNIRVIDPAIVPENPIKPRKKVNLMLGLIVGAMLGIGLAFFKEYLDDTVKDTDEAKRLLGMPMLGMIPYMQTHSKDKDCNNLKLITKMGPKSAAAEAFRSLRTGIHFSAINKRRQVIMLTSSFPNEGKSTLSTNLAITLSQTGSRVVLVGGDLRRPSLHKMFGISKTPGLTEVLTGDCDIDDVIHQTDGIGIDLINAGTIPPNPSELLESRQMHEVLQSLRMRYEHIIIDAPPLLAVTDAHVLTTMADMVLVVMEAGRVPRKLAQRVKESLEMVSAPVCGLILNDKSKKGAEYYSYYSSRYYGHGYGYGYGYGGYYEEEENKKEKGIFKKLTHTELIES